MSAEPTSYTQIPRATLWLLEGDEFVMGGTALDAQPTFTAQVDSFYIGKTAITNEQFEAFNPDFSRGAYSRGDDDPAVGISLLDASEYCAWYSRISKKHFRLPTEMEWEFACRGGTTGRYFVGDDQAGEYLWSAENSDGHAHAADTLKTNPAGLLNMLGNVWEWTCSSHRPYPLPEAWKAEPIESDKLYVLRGGSFREPLAEIGCGIRRAERPDLRMDNAGFRIVRSL